MLLFNVNLINCCCFPWCWVCPFCRSRCRYTWRTGFTHWWRFYPAVRMQTQASNRKSSICILVSTATISPWYKNNACIRINHSLDWRRGDRAWKHFRKYVWINTLTGTTMPKWWTTMFTMDSQCLPFFYNLRIISPAQQIHINTNTNHNHNNSSSSNSIPVAEVMSEQLTKIAHSAKIRPRQNRKNHFW